MVNFRCDWKDCTYEDYSKTNFDNHVKSVHKKIKDIECTYENCSYTCSRIWTMQSHINMVHKKIRNHKCPNENCDMAFTLKGHLKIHKKICKNRKSGTKGELLVKKTLEKMGFVIDETYYFRKTYLPLTESSGRQLPFDFRIKLDGDPIFIEYDGKPHYFPTTWFNNQTKKESIERFKRYQEYDKIKTNFCDENLLLLLRIPYWDKKDIPKLVKNFIKTNTTWD